MTKVLTDNEIEAKLSTKDLVRLDDHVQDVKQGVDEALSSDQPIGKHTKPIADGLRELKADAKRFGLQNLYKNVLSLVKGYYIDDLYCLEDDFFVKVGKRPDHPEGWVC